MLTDELLMVASDVVAAVATELEPKASGNAQWRLLAWTVAAARGATINLDTALALTVGKRLDRHQRCRRGRCQLACQWRHSQRVMLCRALALVLPFVLLRLLVAPCWWQVAARRNSLRW